MCRTLILFVAVSVTTSSAFGQETVSVLSINYEVDNAKVVQYCTQYSMDHLKIDTKIPEDFLRGVLKSDGYVVTGGEKDRWAVKSQRFMFTVDPRLSNPDRHFESLQMIMEMGSVMTYQVVVKGAPSKEYLTRLGHLIAEFDARQKKVYDQVLTDKVSIKVVYTKVQDRYSFVLNYR